MWGAVLPLSPPPPGGPWLGLGALVGTSEGPSTAIDTYRRLAEVYDTVYAWKDYAAEARRIRQLVLRYGPRRPQRLLDVGCGTGAHLRHLARWFDAVGLDRSGPMLEVARERLPGVRFVRGRMERFDLGERFDAITCLFSAIGYVRSPEDLRRTLSTFADHLAPGGVVIVEPWLFPTTYRPGSIHLGTYGSKRRPIVRMNLSDRKGRRSIMDMHYLVGEPTGVRHWVERHDMGLFSPREYRRAFAAAGLRCLFQNAGFTGRRGLFVGIKSGTPRRRSFLRARPARVRGARTPGEGPRTGTTRPRPPAG